MSTEPTRDTIFDITEGDWHVVAARSVFTAGAATVVFEYKGKHYATVSYPAYKVWNIPAHLSDITEDFEVGMAAASWNGLPSAAGGVSL